MGNCNTKSKIQQKEPEGLFQREKWKEDKREERRKKPVSGKKRVAGAPPVTLAPPPAPRPAPSPLRSYDEEALERMRHQLHTDSDAFLLNNILLSVQFFENYEREIQHLKNNPASEWDSQINESMVRYNKHVFLADRLHETVHEHVRYRRPPNPNSASPGGASVLEPLSPLRMFVIYDNIEASEPGDTSDYSAVLDAPFYKMLMEETKEPGYIRLRKLEVLQNTSNDQVDDGVSVKSGPSDFTESGKESNASDDSSFATRGQGEELLMQLKSKLENDIILKTKITAPIVAHKKIKAMKTEHDSLDISGRRPSGPIRQMSSVAAKATLSNISRIKQVNEPLKELKETERKGSGLTKAEVEKFNKLQESASQENRQRKSILKTSNNRRPSGPTKQSSNVTSKYSIRKYSDDNSIPEETESSGYRSTSNSSPQNGSDSDYGYATITRLTTPKPLSMSSKTNTSESTGIVSDECWTPVKVKAIEYWSNDDEEDEEEDFKDNKNYGAKNLYETKYYLNSISFMSNFVDIFMSKLGKGLGFSTDAIENALTQGASIYCDTLKYNTTVGYEVVPAVIAAWPSTANEWIIRQRRTIRNPKTNFSYQWPTKYMVNKARGSGCLLVPIGYRPKKGINPDQELQWRIIFPTAERYLESCLAHSQVRCYMFVLALVKTFMESETYKIGLDSSHIKNHLFTLCEDNYAMWPEDRLGETLRIFLRTLYTNFTQARFPDYFIETCDQFKSLPRTMLLRLQRRLADIIETPVMHLLCAIRNLKYTSNDFYPQFDYMRLYRILTTKNVLRLVNPHFKVTTSEQDEEEHSESEDEYKEAQIGFWDKAKSKDKHYQWKKEQQRQEDAQRRAAVRAELKTKKAAAAAAHFIDKSISVPAKMDMDRRRLVLEFFISHFISMAQHSEKFDATKQAIIYLEHSQRLTMLLREEPVSEETAADFLATIRSKLNEYKLKLVSQSALKLPKRNDSVVLHSFNRTKLHSVGRLRPEYVNVTSQDSPPPPSPGSQHFTFVDIHSEHHNNRRINTVKLRENDTDSDEDSKL